MLSGGSVAQARLCFARMQGVAAVLAALLIGTVGGSSDAFELQSPAFRAEGEIPARHTCDGADVSPPLRWVDPPAGTKGFALIADDPDAPGGTWVHWVLYEMSPEARELPEGVSSRDTVAGIGRQGANDFRRVGYGG
ncbi:MAG TPA: YbhB/YbcL family Raf kinase inhibitor-like protein, partial [Candidatus Acidoferrum sp.]|nr:YbhB/YbcL family Raf kinase inhibitor-like protein [Candidatus Acidoferrum sp.]